MASLTQIDMSLSKLWEMVKGQGSRVCCSPRDYKESDTTEKWNNNNSVLDAGVLGSVFELACLILTMTGTQSSENKGMCRLELESHRLLFPLCRS